MADNTNPALLPVVAIQQSQTIPVQLKDVNTNFRYSLDSLMLADIKAINNELFNLFTTTPGERIFEPTFGCSMMNYLFDPCDNITAWTMRTELLSALKKWMPHIQVQQGTTVIAFPDQRIFEVTFVYSIPNFITQGQLDLTLIQPR